MGATSTRTGKGSKDVFKTSEKGRSENLFAIRYSLFAQTQLLKT